MPNNLPGLQVFVTIDSTTVTSHDTDIIELSVEDSDEGDNEIEVSFQDNDYKIADSSLFVVGKKMSVKWGYINGEMSQIRSGILMKPSVSYTEEGVVTKVCVKTKSATLAARRPQKTYGKTTVKDIVSEIANRSGLTLRITGGSESVPAFSHANWSDRQVLRVLADRFGYQVSYIGDTIIFAPRDYGATPSLELVFGQGEASNVHEAHINIDASKSLGDILSQAISVDPNTKKTVKAKSKNDNQTLAISAEDGHSWLTSTPSPSPATPLQGVTAKVTSALDSSAQQAEDVISHITTPDSDPTNAQLLATAEKLKKQRRKGELSIHSLGIPSATARQVVTVKGLAKRDSGNWYTISVTHKLDQDGYTCDWELSRHGNNTRKPPVKNKEPLNKQGASSKSDPTKKVIAVDAVTGKVTE